MSDQPNNPNFDHAKTIYEFRVVDLNGEHVKLEKYDGNVCVIVNTASNSKLTEIYFKQFNRLMDHFGNRGFRILAFPCDQFGHEEPLTSEALVQHAEELKVKFDVFARVEVNGINAIPLFKFLKHHLHDRKHGDVIKGSYTKFLINQSGFPTERFGTEVTPAEMEKAIESYLDPLPEQTKQVSAIKTNLDDLEI